VHMAALGHPIVADRLYGRSDRVLNPILARQALHAFRIEVHHPATGQEMAFEAPLAPDIERLLRFLREGGADVPETLAEEMGVADERPPAGTLDEDAGD